jgi:tetratricopeptide (TPR) repeat protein
MGGRSVLGPGKKDPGAALRSSLIAALMDLPFINALPDRRMLLTLVRQDVVRFPDVQERSEARLHVVDIVLACLGHPGGLRALRAALETMAPYAEGTRRARQLIESATLSGLLSESDLERARDILRRVDQREVSLPPNLDGEPTGDAPSANVVGLIERFDRLAGEQAGSEGLPPALLLLEHTARQVDRHLAVELQGWVDTQAEWLEVQSELRDLRSRMSLDSAGDAVVEGARTTVAGHDLNEGHVGKGDHQQQYSGLGSSGQAGGGAPVPTDPDVNAQHVYPLQSLPAEGQSQRGEEDPMSPLAPATVRDVERLPQVWGDIPPRNPNFTGRESLLNDLHSRLAVERETSVLPHALHGMGGVGKSQVAIEYVHRHRSDYDLIWWIPSEHSGQVLSALSDLAHRLELDASHEAISAVPAVREALSTRTTPYDNWLLVFDNAESLSEVRPFFPTGGAGRILVTSRNPEWAGVTHPLEVDVFTRTESKTFLMKRTPELTEEEADHLAEALGDLPLAVEQAASWRVATGMPVNEYLRLLEDKRIELLGFGESPDYEISVAAAWNVSMDKLAQVNEAALQLLQVCSFFAPEPISRDLFAGSPSAPITESLDETLRDPIKLARAIRDIQRYALAKFDHRNGTLQMHRLVQAVLVGRMDPERQDVMRQGAHTLLANGDPNKPASPEHWPRYQALRPHVTVSGAVKSHDPRVHQLVFNMVKFLYYWGDHEGCREFAEIVHDARRADLGEDNEHTVAVAKWWAWILWVLGAFADAAKINRRALELSRAAFGDSDEGTVDAMTRVAIDLRTAGDFAGALALDRRAVEVGVREFGEDDPATLRAAFHLGVSLRQTGAFAEAWELDRDTHERQCAILGENDDATLRTLNFLTIDQRELGDYLGARHRQQEVYETFVKVFGPENPAVTRAARNLAVARRKAGDHDDARQLAEETLGKFRVRYGDDYPDTMAAALNVAVDLRHAGDLDGACELGEQTLERYVRVFGDRHPHTLSATANLAIVRRLLGDVAYAHQSDLTTLEALHATLGRDHPISLTCATNLANDLSRLGEYQAAYECDIDTLERSRRALGENHPSTLACSLNLALDLRALGRVQEADKIHADTLARFRHILGDRHPATLNALQSVRADCDMDPLPL